MTAARKQKSNPYPVPARVLRLKTIRQRGDDVRWLQYHLIRLEFLPALNAKGKSNIDGIFGGDTETAVRTAQKHFGITVDGIAGTQTVYVLRYN